MARWKVAATSGWAPRWSKKSVPYVTAERDPTLDEAGGQRGGRRVVEVTADQRGAAHRGQGGADRGQPGPGPGRPGRARRRRRVRAAPGRARSGSAPTAAAAACAGLRTAGQDLVEAEPGGGVDQLSRQEAVQQTGQPHAGRGVGHAWSLPGVEVRFGRHAHSSRQCRVGRIRDERPRRCGGHGRGARSATTGSGHGYTRARSRLARTSSTVSSGVCADESSQ